MRLLTTLMNGKQFYAKPVLAASVMYINQGNLRVLRITANASRNAIATQASRLLPGRLNVRRCVAQVVYRVGCGLWLRAPILRSA